MSKLIVGCGYVGERLASYWLRKGEDVFATTRSESRAAKLAAMGISPVLWDVTKQNAVELPDATMVVFSVGFDRATAKVEGHSIEDVYVKGLRRALSECPNSAERFVYLSSTGVYGETTGEWVDERTVCRPNRDGGKACLAAEEMLRADPTFGSKAMVLRLAGIYGPQRLPQAAVLQRGEPLAVAADAYLNLIHVDDIVPIVAACEHANAPDTICVSDGQPALRQDFYHCLAELLGTPSPVFEPPVPGSSRAERARGSKRIRNQRLLERIKPKFSFPSYREGLASIVGEMNASRESGH